MTTEEWRNKSDDFRAGVKACDQGEDVIIEVLHAPTVDAIPVVHGHWVWDENGMDWGLGAWRCSVCGCKPETWWEADRKYIPRRCSGSKFCGNCGAKMDEVI